MRQIRRDQSLQLLHQLMRALGRKIEAEQFDGDETILLGLIGAEDGTESTCADLVKHAEWAEGVGRRGAGSVRVQWVLLKEGARIVTLKHTRFNRLGVLQYRSRGFESGRISRSTVVIR